MTRDRVNFGDPGMGGALRHDGSGVVEVSLPRQCDGTAYMLPSDLHAAIALLTEAARQAPPCRACGLAPMSEADLQAELRDHAEQHGAASTARPSTCAVCGWPPRLETPRGPSPIDEEGF